MKKRKHMMKFSIGIYECLDGDEAYIECEGDFPKTKRGALEASIRKWEAIVLALEDGTIKRDNLPFWNAGEECALCELYSEREDSRGIICAGCPVRQSTGLEQCDGTPFYEARMAETIKSALKYSREELEFLKSLR